MKLKRLLYIKTDNFALTLDPAYNPETHGYNPETHGYDPTEFTIEHLYQGRDNVIWSNVILTHASCYTDHNGDAVNATLQWLKRDILSHTGTQVFLDEHGNLVTLNDGIDTESNKIPDVDDYPKILFQMDVAQNMHPELARLETAKIYAVDEPTQFILASYSPYVIDTVYWKHVIVMSQNDNTEFVFSPNSDINVVSQQILLTFMTNSESIVPSLNSLKKS